MGGRKKNMRINFGTEHFWNRATFHSIETTLTLIKLIIVRVDDPRQTNPFFALCR